MCRCFNNGYGYTKNKEKKSQKIWRDFRRIYRNSVNKESDICTSILIFFFRTRPQLFIIFNSMSAEQFISNAHPAYIESLYRDYQQNPAELEIGWRKFFEGFDFALQYQNATAGENGADNTAAVNTGIYHTADLDIPNEIKVYSLIYSYRKNAHLISKTNPIRQRKDRRAYLELSDYGLMENLLDQEFYVGNILGLGKTTLSRIIAFLQKAYGGSIGVEYHYIRDPQRRHWIREKIEMRPDNFGFSIDKKKRILKKLNEATVLEEFWVKSFWAKNVSRSKAAKAPFLP